ncbi:MAG: hypothetical protein ACJ709_07105 [Nitrososphaeraceae archaeon]
MAFSLRKAIKSTHRHPINRILHCIGAPIYIAGIALILDNLLFSIKYPNLAYPIIMCCTAVGLFLLGNLKAMTLIVLFKYVVRSRKSAAVSAVTNK